MIKRVRKMTIVTQARRATPAGFLYTSSASYSVHWGISWSTRLISMPWEPRVVGSADLVGFRDPGYDLRAINLQVY